MFTIFGDTPGCQCALCKVYRNLEMFSDGWADPRRYYLEGVDEFIARVPDGFLEWPTDHIGLGYGLSLNRESNEHNPDRQSQQVPVVQLRDVCQ